MSVLGGTGQAYKLSTPTLDLALATALSNQLKTAATQPTLKPQAGFQPIQTFIGALLSPAQNPQLFQVLEQQQQPVQLKKIVKAGATKSAQPDPLFQVWVHGRLVTELPNQRLAESMVQQLRQAMQQGKFDPARLQPALIKGQPGGRWGDRTLFTIDSETEQAFGRSGELIAIEWVNQLRKAMSVPALSLTEAQTSLYKLTETSERLEGLASWYGPYFHGRLTAAGEIFDENDMTAAHPSLPFDTYLKVTNLDNGRTVVVRVNDRGPYWENRTLDLSREAARRLGSESTGVVPVQIVVMDRPS